MIHCTHCHNEFEPESNLELRCPKCQSEVIELFKLGKRDSWSKERLNRFKEFFDKV